MCGTVPEVSELVSGCVDNEQPASVRRLKTCVALSESCRVHCVLCFFFGGGLQLERLLKRLNS